MRNNIYKPENAYITWICSTTAWRNNNCPQKWKEENSEWERETLSNLFSPDQGLQTPSVLLSQFWMSGVEQ